MAKKKKYDCWHIRPDRRRRPCKMLPLQEIVVLSANQPSQRVKDCMGRSPKLQRIGENAQTKARDNFSFDTVWVCVFRNVDNRNVVVFFFLFF